jgi:hypothetical protein
MHHAKVKVYYLQGVLVPDACADANQGTTVYSIQVGRYQTKSDESKHLQYV